jgi:hypothetical protein
MPRFVVFADAAGNRVARSKVDDLVRAATGLPADPDAFCQTFDLLEYGLASGMTLARMHEAFLTDMGPDAAMTRAIAAVRAAGIRASAGYVPA